MDMEASDDVPDHLSEEESSVMGEDKEVEALVHVDEKRKASLSPKRPKVWPEFDTECAIRSKKTVDAVREVFEDDVDPYQPTMASEYCDEIFEYMEQLEVKAAFPLWIASF
jgi:G2/mitotic-specific cyclin 2